MSQGSSINNNKPGFITRVKSAILLCVELILKKTYLETKNSSKSNRTILLKTDAIGDYIIARNLMNYYIQHPKNKAADFYLIANSKLKTLIEKTDKDYYKEVIYYDNAIAKKFKTLYKFYFRVKKVKSNQVILPVFSPTNQMDEMVAISGANQKITLKGDKENKVMGKEVDVNYTSLIDVDDINKSKLTHEFSKMKTFFETLLNEPISIKAPVLPKKEANSKFNRIVICPGSAGAYKIWHPKNYAELISRLKQTYPSLCIDIICGPGEEYLGEEIKKHTKGYDKIKNIYDISELCSEIEKCDLLISNDSAPIHIAVALNVFSICVFNGSRYGRFVPYPEEIANTSFVILPPSIQVKVNENNAEYLQYIYSHLTNEDINLISVDSVYKKAEEILVN